MSMNHLVETIKEIFYYLRQYKARTFMTLFGIVWGTVSIVVLLAFGVGVKKALSKSMHGMGERIAILWPGRTSLAWMGFNRDRYIHLVEEDAELLRREVREIRSISPEYAKWNAPLRHGEQINKPNIAGIYPEYAEMRNIQSQPGGRWINDLDMQERRRVSGSVSLCRGFAFSGHRCARPQAGELFLQRPRPGPRLYSGHYLSVALWPPHYRQYRLSNQRTS